MTHRLALGIVPVLALIGVAAADAGSAFDRIEKALPPGWTMLATGSELVFRHDKPCYVTAVHHDNAAQVPLAGAESAGAAGARPAARPVAPAGPMITVELRYHLEPRWTSAQLAAAKATNQQVAAEIRALSARYRVDAIHHSKGHPLPANADERARLDAYDSAHARLAKRLVVLPHCSAGEVSVFDGADTYAQLSLELDPPEVIAEAHKILGALELHCR